MEEKQKMERNSPSRYEDHDYYFLKRLLKYLRKVGEEKINVCKEYHHNFCIEMHFAMHNSNLYSISVSVLQSKVLAITFFLLHINDLSSTSNHESDFDDCILHVS